MSGLQPLVVSPYNLLWTINSTANDLIRKRFDLLNSPQAIAGGIFYLFGYLSSLYHLVFLSQQKVFAMRWPLKYKVQEARTVYIGLGIVWILAILSAVAPACFPDEYSFFYSSDNFVFALGGMKATSFVSLIITGWVLPFLVMTCFMIYSTILIRRNVRRSKRLTGNNSDQEVHNKRETSMLKTVALMQIGFTLTLAPLGFSGLAPFVFPSLRASSSCRRRVIAKVVCFHLVMCNSLVNPIVYSFRENDFRKSIVQCFQRRKRLVNAHNRNQNIEQAVATSFNELM